jgi:hypothetical protein
MSEGLIGLQQRGEKLARARVGPPILISRPGVYEDVMRR